MRTIEGNTGASVVARNTFSLTGGGITGYGVPDYGSAPSAGGGGLGGQRQEYDPANELAALNNFLERISENTDKPPEIIDRDFETDTDIPDQPESNY